MEQKKANKDLIESYKLTTIRDKIGIYGQRLILRLVEFATEEGATKGLRFTSGEDLRKVEVFQDMNYQCIKMPLKYITGDSDNRSKPRASIKALMNEIIEAEGDEGKWFAFPLLSFAQIEKGMLTVEVRKELWQVFMDFRKGFRRFELDAALKLKSTYSLRLYKLVSEQYDIKSIDFQLEELKKMLGVADKYPQASDFFKGVIEPAKKELDQVAPWSFDYTPLMSEVRTRGRKAIIGVRFFPIYHPEHRDPELAEKRLLSKYSSQVTLPHITGEQKDILVHKFGFTQKGLNNNAELLDKAVKYLDFTEFLDRMSERMSKVRPKNPSGFLINSIKKALKALGIE